MHLFFSVGEPSGDQHTAHLIDALKADYPDLRCTGFGGPQMEAAGCRLLGRLTDLAVMGVGSVLPRLADFHTHLRRARGFLSRERPDAVVLVDFPGFNWWVARAAKAAGIPVLYWLPPQLWAWAPWRIAKMRRFVDHVLCALPFEHEWYADRGMPAQYVGHPFFDEVLKKPLDERFLADWQNDNAATVALLPGSRDQEVSSNWPVLRGAAARLARKHPEVRFAVACFRPRHADFCRQDLQGESALRDRVQPFVGRTSELISAADCTLTVSGSVSLELLARETPTVIVYRAGPLMWLLGKLLIRCRWITLPNLIAGETVMPEFPFTGPCEPIVEQVSAILDQWLSDAGERDRVRQRLSQLRQQTAVGGALERTAQAILAHLGVVPERRRLAA